MSVYGVVGLGLIGGSLALDLHHGGHDVLGWDVDAAHRREAAAAGLPVADGCEAVAARCDVVVVATPAGAVAATLRRLDEAATAPLVTTDVASVQGRLGIADVAWRHLRHLGGHPMTGTERAGFRAARRGMFEGQPWLLMPHEGTDAAALRAVVRLVLAVGGAGVPIAPSAHDDVVAHLSHLPHVLAYTAYGELRARFPASVEGLAGGSFRGLTRVAASRPAFWGEVLELNRVAVADAVAALRDRLADVEQQLRHGDAAALADLLAAGHREVGRPRPAVPPPTPLPVAGALPAGVLATLRSHGGDGLCIAGLDDGELAWTAL